MTRIIMTDEEAFVQEVTAALKRPLTEDECSIVADCYLLGFDVARTVKEVLE